LNHSDYKPFAFAAGNADRAKQSQKNGVRKITCYVVDLVEVDVVYILHEANEGNKEFCRAPGVIAGKP
jgi:hypothetical protein